MITAACWTAVQEGRAEPDDWFPVPGGLSKWNKRAMGICKGCALREACLNFALKPVRNHSSDLALYGIWGGTTPYQRETMRRRK